MEQEIHTRVDAIRRELESAALERWGRAPEIIAVSKTVEAPKVNLLKGSGILRLGENRVQEIMEKLPYLNSSFQIDLIGRLQNNKVKYIIDKVGMIQSLDRMSLAQEIDRRAQQHGLRMPVLVQVNIGAEPQKGGVTVEETISFARMAAGLPGLEIRGLMAVMPDLDDDALLRPYFTKMRSLFDRLREENIAGTRIEELSMGMSGDYLLAAQEGATHVRIGSAIFGSRTAAAPKQQHEDTLKGDIDTWVF
ncbi:MAG: YggS family pyridoxal phosphate-dependent enzyme [Clostridiales bacterium]|nr:YggS family pyridoxal phosphate-dependent enzyme [Clostridiales bacterium]